MKLEEHTNIIHEIAQNLTDQAKVTELLTKLSNDYTTQVAEIEKMPKLLADNEALRSANMNLFLQIGSVPKPDENKPPIVPPEGTQTEPELKYENLFNENGGLK